ncbi:MAG: ABC transporter substrate-binding protein [Pseudomonadota bacterium]
MVAVPAAKAQKPERIVVAGGDLTEIVFALGHGDRLIGVDSTSGYPETAKDLAQIGYVRRISAEGILSLSPDLMLVADDAGPVDTLSALSSAGIRIEIAPTTTSVDDIPDKIRFVATALSDPDAGEALATTFIQDLAAARTMVGDLSDRPRVLFILSTSGGAPLVGGPGSTADLLIREAGAQNAASGFEGYKPMNREAIIAAAPDVILMTQAHSDRLGGLDDVLDRPDIALTPAGRARRGVTLDALTLLGMGPRTPTAIRQLATRIRMSTPDIGEPDG